MNPSAGALSGGLAHRLERSRMRDVAVSGGGANGLACRHAERPVPHGGREQGLLRLRGDLRRRRQLSQPAVFAPYEGREAVAMLLTAVAGVFEDFRYTDQVETGDTATLAFSARVGDRELDGIDLLRFDGEGRVREMAVYIRPLSGLNALAEAMQRRLEELSGS